MRHKDSIERYIDHDVLLEQRLIWVGSNILENGEESGTNAHMAEHLIKNLNILQLGPKGEEPITIQMNNLGGIWHHGIAMYDAIRACRAPVRIEATGYCMSMATVVLQAADERILHPNCRVMIHDGEDGYYGHAKNFELWARESKILRHDMYKIYAERSGKPVGYWDKRCTLDRIMSAEEAVREGLADRVLPPVKNFPVRQTIRAKKKR